MIELRGDLWNLPPAADTASNEPSKCLRIITTNGATRKDGAAIMGRGCARQAKDIIPSIEYRFGELLRAHGNRVMRLGILADGSHLGSFPVKHHWREAADLDLIDRSAHQLVEIANRFQYTKILIPKPGCGNGQRSWEGEVRPILEETLVGNKFVIVSY